MRSTQPKLKKNLIPILLVIGILVLWLSQTPEHSSSAASTPHKVHIAFGFHVNLRHSFRGDTNDENGFGQDIGVIRHIIGELDRFNRMGVPVSAVWDFDNLFSLEELLPAHAPDIISDIQRRVSENRDDVILMSYNNGLMSAMTQPEFRAAIERSITNENSSGVLDIFGRFAPVVRPQEMMTTAGNFEIYKQTGIDYVALYHSATPFDAFRLFSRELTPTEAHNPVDYYNPDTGEQIAIIPTYHAGDLVEHVSLRNWAQSLHRLQMKGEIDRDVLIFINFDADAEFWAGAELPWHLKWLPNTGGLGQLITSVADLKFVVFNQLSDYLATHATAGSIHFTQDTADGSFNGYNSWAEKALSSDYWTRIVRNRRAHQMADNLFATINQEVPAELKELQRLSFETRLRALSTTNFGLATPFLARQREAAMEALLARLDSYTDRIETQTALRARALIKDATPPAPPLTGARLVDTFVHLNRSTDGDRILEFRLPAETSAAGGFFIADGRGQIIPAAVAETKRQADASQVYIAMRVARQQAMPVGVYFLFERAGSPPAAPVSEEALVASKRVLKNEFISVHFNEKGHVARVLQNGELQLEGDSLIPFVQYKTQRLSPEQLSVTVLETGGDGVVAVRLAGRWDGPPGATRAPGWVDYRLRLMRGLPYLFFDGEVRYPDTFRRTVFQAQKPMLARKIDSGWKSVAPMELRFAAHASKERPFVIHKRNFLGQEGAYVVDYFRHTPVNLNVASINNHVTAEYAGVTAAGRGMAVAMNTDLNANFAFCPFQMTYKPKEDALAIRANPFGTYHGDQLLPPTRGNRLGYEAVLLSAPQLHSAGPTFNGHHHRFEVMISFFSGDVIPEGVKADLIAFATRPLNFRSHGTIRPKEPPQAHLPPAGFLALPYERGIVFHWEAADPPGTQYRIRYKSMRTLTEKSITVSDTRTHIVDRAEFTASDDVFTATIETLHATGSLSGRSPEIRFNLKPDIEPTWNIPTGFKAKLLWTNASAWMQRNLL